MGMSDIEADLMLAKAQAEQYRNERDHLVLRLRHLLESETIREYDKKNAAGDYELDIRELDCIVRKAALVIMARGG